MSKPLRCKLGFHKGVPMAIRSEEIELWNCENIDRIIWNYYAKMKCILCEKEYEVPISHDEYYRLWKIGEGLPEYKEGE